MKTEAVRIQDVKTNPNNPRIIKDDKFKKLVRSIKEFPEMLKLRPIVVDENNIVLGGNMRLRACKEAGLKEVHIIKADQLTEKQQREFIIKDNVGFGEWDWDILGNEWSELPLDKWGLDGVKYDWDDLDYIEEAEKKDVAEDKITINLKEDAKHKSKIREGLDKWLIENYPNCEIK